MVLYHVFAYNTISIHGIRLAIAKMLLCFNFISYWNVIEHKKRNPTKYELSGQLCTVHEECNSCLTSKCNIERWIDHKISVGHITSLLSRKRCRQAVPNLKNLEQIFCKSSAIFVMPGTRPI